MTGSVSDFYRALTVHLNPPKLDEEATRRFLEDFKQDAGGFSGRVYQLAAEKLRTAPAPKDNPRKWPGNGTIRAACREAQAQLAAETVKPVKKSQRDAWSDDAQRQADRILLAHPALTRMAIAEGWLRGLWDFCRQEGREPRPGEHRNIIAKAQDRKRRALLHEADAK
jgi:hypothetical protein